MPKKLSRAQERAMFAKAKTMVKKAGFKIGSSDVTPNTIRFRQREPGEFKEGTQRNIDIGRPGYIKATVAKPKGTNKTRIQSVWISKEDLR